jgi:hypothetical protein
MDAMKAATCWECDAATRRPVIVTIVLSDGVERHLRLCPVCHQTCYLPLFAQASADGEHLDPPSPAPDVPGSRRTYH